MAQLITKAQARLFSLARADLHTIHLSLIIENLNWLLQTSELLQLALDSYPGQLSIHYPKHKRFKLNFSLLPRPMCSPNPLKALTIVTDGSGGSHKSEIAWCPRMTL